VCHEPLTPGVRFCPYCGAHVEDDFDDDAAMTGRVVDDDSRRNGYPSLRSLPSSGLSPWS
jgi:hypothetical protein